MTFREVDRNNLDDWIGSRLNGWLRLYLCVLYMNERMKWNDSLMKLLDKIGDVRKIGWGIGIIELICEI